MTSMVNVFEEMTTRQNAFAKYVQRMKSTPLFVVMMEKRMQVNVNWKDLHVNRRRA